MGFCEIGCSSSTNSFAFRTSGLWYLYCGVVVVHREFPDVVGASDYARYATVPLLREQYDMIPRELENVRCPYLGPVAREANTRRAGFIHGIPQRSARPCPRPSAGSRQAYRLLCPFEKPEKPAGSVTCASSSIRDVRRVFTVAVAAGESRYSTTWRHPNADLLCNACVTPGSPERSATDHRAFRCTDVSR
ncbi:hypothetical protein FHU14_001968 [Mesorhizobium sp. RMAD-H1]|nr:hypothetical protein [Mesorhizobium sp. RMAD-H1]